MPQPFGQAIDPSGQVAAIGAERQTEPIRRGFLLRRRIEIGEIQDAVIFLVARTRKKPARRLRQQHRQFTHRRGPARTPRQNPRPQKRIVSQLIGPLIVTKRLLHRALELIA